MLLGIVAGLTTCALWGLTFIAPRTVAPFTAWDLTIARYGIFGLTCLLLMVDRRFRPTGLFPSRLVIGLLLGGAGYVGYFISEAFAVQFAGAAVPPVITGTMPVFLAIIANLRDRSTPWKALALPLMLIAAGVATVNIAAVGISDVAEQGSIMLGVVASLAALGIWIAYGLANSAVMRSADAPDGLQWTGLQGIGAAIGSLLLLPLASFDLAHTVSAPEILRFLLWAVIMGFAGSWFNLMLGVRVTSPAAGAGGAAHRRRNRLRACLWFYLRGAVSDASRDDWGDDADCRRLLRYRCIQQTAAISRILTDIMTSATGEPGLARHRAIPSAHN